MKMSDVTTDRQMRGEWNSGFVGCAQKRNVFVPRLQREYCPTYRFSKANLIACSVARSVVEKFAGFFGTAEYAFAKRRVDIFRRRSNHRDFCIMNKHRTV